LKEGYDIVIDEGGSGQWFGGDNGFKYYSHLRPRNVGAGQSVTLPINYQLSAVSLLFDGYNIFTGGKNSGFDYYYEPEQKGHAVEMNLQIRDKDGNILASRKHNIDESFTNGWVRIKFDYEMKAHNKYILTWHITNGEYNHLMHWAPRNKFDSFTFGEGYMSVNVRQGQNINHWEYWVKTYFDLCIKLHSD
jgi:hypothetical protein